MARSSRVTRRRAARSRWNAAHPLRQGPLTLVALGLLVLALCGRLERYIWLFALVAELGVVLASIALSLGIVAARTHRWLACGATALTLLVAVWPLFPLLRPTRPTPAQGPTLSVMHAHVSHAPISPSDVASWLAAQGPEAAAITGLHANDAVRLGRTLASYRVRIRKETSTGRHGALFLREALSVTNERRDDLALSGVLRVGRCDVRVVAVDLPELRSFAQGKARAQRLAELERSRKVARSVWLGHLGSRAQASDLLGFQAAQELRDSRRGHGLLGTSPAWLGPLAFPVDHVLVHGWIGVRTRSKGPPLVPGAHSTALATLELTEPRCRPQ